VLLLSVASVGLNVYHAHAVFIQVLKFLVQFSEVYVSPLLPESSVLVCHVDDGVADAVGGRVGFDIDGPISVGFAARQARLVPLAG